MLFRTNKEKINYQKVLSLPNLCMVSRKNKVKIKKQTTSSCRTPGSHVIEFNKNLFSIFYIVFSS